MRIIAIVLLSVWLTACVNKSSNIEDPPVGIGSEEASLTVTDKGLLLSWMEPSEGEINLKISIFNGFEWSEPKTVARGLNWFVNWADFPAVIANGDKLFAHFLERSSPDTYDYAIMYTLSNDYGATWSDPRQLHEDTILAEHGFLSGSAFDDGFYVTWLDGRKTKSDSGAMTLRSAYVDANGNVSQRAEIDDRTCDCCQTSMAITGEKPIVFYRDRSDQEVRDIYSAILSEGAWMEPSAVYIDNWEINACPVNGPASVAKGDTVGVTWFTGAQGTGKVKLSISTDGGNSFMEPVIVNRKETLGRLDLKIYENIFYLSYMIYEKGQARIILARYSIDGQLLNKVPLATINHQRDSGFPRAAIWQDQYLITWTGSNEQKIRLLSYPLTNEIKSISGLYNFN